MSISETPKPFNSWLRNTDIESFISMRSLIGNKKSIYAIAFSPDGQILASTSNCFENNDSVALWSFKSGTLLATLPGEKTYGGGVNTIAFSPDGKILVTGYYYGMDSIVELWSLETRTLLATLPGYGECKVSSVVFSGDGKILASSGEISGSIDLWSWKKIGDILACSGKTDTPIELFLYPTTLTGHESQVLCLAFSGDGKTLASGDMDGVIKLWSVETGKSVVTITTDEDGVDVVAFSPDGKTLASIDGTGSTIKLWLVETGELVATLCEHESSTYTLAFNPDGMTLASGGSDKTIKLWSVETGGLVATLSGHESCIYALAFSSDGLTLASGSNDGIIKLWQLL
ncbi:MAG: WD40 repeat domain-containing protein [Okeania sp. SIO2F4]|uniref:WD40 repeat domain-containing protein n=1 Tax=Okeania sp. SIO2F4 TaxID=2607790 RepID=UPI001429108C|nr:WD40 repeat domain-containing protein [Okeania sp. SIO2F4]NES07355.1 WD40 repeat domain-containing protein [Okeania sp. SIO2F4]